MSEGNREEREKGETEGGEGYKLPLIDMDYDTAKKKTAEYGVKIYREFSSLSEYLKSNGVGYIKRKFLAGAVKRLVQRKLEPVDALDLWDSIQSGEDPLKFWDKEQDGDLAGNFAVYLQKFAQVLDADLKQQLEEFDERLAKEGAQVVILAIKDARPDLYDVLVPKRNHYEYDPNNPEDPKVVDNADDLEGEERKKALRNFEKLLNEREDLIPVKVVGENEILGSLKDPESGNRRVYRIKREVRREVRPGAENYISTQVGMLRRDLREAIRRL